MVFKTGFPAQIPKRTSFYLTATLVIFRSYPFFSFSQALISPSKVVLSGSASGCHRNTAPSPRPSTPKSSQRNKNNKHNLQPMVTLNAQTYHTLSPVKGPYFKTHAVLLQVRVGPGDREARPNLNSQPHPLPSVWLARQHLLKQVQSLRSQISSPLTAQREYPNSKPETRDPSRWCFSTAASSTHNQRNHTTT